MKIISPLAVYLPRKTKADKKVILNLNNYRNWHYIVSNQVKQTYSDLISGQIRGMKFNMVRLKFKLYKASKRKCDRANVYAIQEKFFCDALVNNGVIPDDSDEHIKESIYLAVDHDPENPRCEIEIEEVKQNLN